MSSLVAAVLLTACAPPRWAEPRCNGLPVTWNMAEPELTAELGKLSDERLLDLMACNMGTSHPPNLGFPDRFITERSPAIAARLLERIEARDEGFLSMAYVGYLETIVGRDPAALTAAQRKSALDKCLTIHPPSKNRNGEIYHWCTGLGGP